MSRRSVRALALDVIVGGLLGLVVAAIVAVNVVIYSGIEDGYEAHLGEIFEQNWFVGVVVVLLFATGPFVGMLMARILRRRRANRGP